LLPVVLLAPCLTSAQSADARADAALLIRVQQAATRLNYAGSFVYQQGSSMQSSRITHLVDSSGEYEKLEALDGLPQEIIRKNDELHCYVPSNKTLLIEKRLGREHFPGLFNGEPVEIIKQYNLIKGENERVAGLDCQLVGLVPRDLSRYGYRLCIDLGSGLLLRAQTISGTGEVIEQIAFTQIKIGGNIDRNLLKPSFQMRDGWRVVRDDAGRKSGSLPQWQVERLPAGFRRTNEFVRPVGRHPDVGQIVFSDGLASLSVFIEALTEGNTPPEGVSAQGAVSVATRRLGDHWITVVGEVPATTVRQVAASIQLRK
jgi:sigma-E factor negative regulatory protein RseB